MSTEIDGRYFDDSEMGIPLNVQCAMCKRSTPDGDACYCSLCNAYVCESCWDDHRAKHAADEASQPEDDLQGDPR